MDEELRAYLEAMEGRLLGMEGRLMARSNNGEARILNRLSAIERDFVNTKSFLVDDALVSGSRWFSISILQNVPEASPNGAGYPALTRLSAPPARSHRS